jgi:hypothetical protein
VAVITVNPRGLDSEPWLKTVMLRVLLQILHELIACHPAAELARNPVARKVRQPADGMQVQTVVAGAPLLSDVLAPLQDDGVCATRPQCRRGRQSRRASADDDDILHQQRLLLISASLLIWACFGPLGRVDRQWVLTPRGWCMTEAVVGRLLGLICVTQRGAGDKSASFFGMVVARPTMPAQRTAGTAIAWCIPSWLTRKPTTAGPKRKAA